MIVVFRVTGPSYWGPQIALSATNVVQCWGGWKASGAESAAQAKWEFILQNESTWARMCQPAQPEHESVNHINMEEKKIHLNGKCDGPAHILGGSTGWPNQSEHKFWCKAEFSAVITPGVRVTWSFGNQQICQFDPQVYSIIKHYYYDLCWKLFFFVWKKTHFQDSLMNKMFKCSYLI